jgi:hypothetical protein
MSRAKVFCIGFQKTGTTSLHAALTYLGWRTAAVVGRGLRPEDLRSEGARLCIETARNHDAAEDMPWPIFFRELDAAYPGSKFILTSRQSEGWFNSIETHFGAFPNPMQAFVYGEDAAAPKGNRERYISVFEAHNEAVRRHFAQRPHDLLSMNLSDGDGWEKLAPFLGVPAPEIPFPSKNRSGDRSRLVFKLKRKVFHALGLAPTPERIS